MALLSTVVYIAVWTQMSGETGFKLSNQSAQQSLAMHTPAHLQGWELQQVQACLRDVSKQRWNTKSIAHLCDVQSGCMHAPAGTSRPAQAAVWLSILRFYAALLFCLLKIKFLHNPCVRKLSICFLMDTCTLLLPVAGRWKEQVRNSLIAHPRPTCLTSASLTLYGLPFADSCRRSAEHWIRD